MRERAGWGRLVGRAVADVKLYRDTSVTVCGGCRRPIPAGEPFQWRKPLPGLPGFPGPAGPLCTRCQPVVPVPAGEQDAKSRRSTAALARRQRARDERDAP